MTYDKTELKVEAGQKINLTLVHTGKMAKEVMGHNWVLLKKGTNLTEFASEAQLATENGYIAQTENIIAHTSIIGGGEEVSIEFEAPEKGEYQFLCTFPAHYALMKGRLIVE